MKWKTEKRKVKDLIPFEGNPRQMSEEQAERLKKSLEKFDLVELPVIDIDNKIVAGHQRIATLMLLGRGEEDIEVRIPDRNLTEEEFKEYNIGSNKWTASWDLDKLANFDMDWLETLGFSANDLNLNIDKIPMTVEKENTCPNCGFKL